MTIQAAFSAPELSNEPLDANGRPSPPSRSAPVGLLNRSQLGELTRRFGSNADALIAARERRIRVKKPKAHAAGVAPKKSNRGRPQKVIRNPFVGYIGPTSGYGRYPYFAMDIVEGIARLDWHCHKAHDASKPLSVRRLMEILEGIENVTTTVVGELLGVADRQAQRYVKAIELALPWLMRARPQRLVDAMEGKLPPGIHDWEDMELAPCPLELAKLHEDIGYESELTTHV